MVIDEGPISSGVRVEQGFEVSGDTTGENRNVIAAFEDAHDPAA
jgi:hypothetical protein